MKKTIVYFLTSILPLLIGGFIGFNIFAIAFNGPIEPYLISILITVAVSSSVLGLIGFKFSSYITVFTFAASTNWPTIFFLAGALEKSGSIIKVGILFLQLFMAGLLPGCIIIFIFNKFMRKAD